jgi:prepilin-type N-terminal cleavage/methylation domain-containing protein
MSAYRLQGRQKGHTLIELVVALVIMAALAASLALRWSPEDSSLPAQADQFGRALRHAQALAMSQGRALTLDVQGATSYAITDGTTTIRDPSGEQQSFSLVNNVTLAGPDVEFDSLGRPVNGASLASTAQSWTLSGDVKIATVTLQPVTGFVTVTP